MKFLHHESESEAEFEGSYLKGQVTDESSRVLYALHGKRFGLVLWNSHYLDDPRVIVSMVEYAHGPSHDPTFISTHTVAASAVPELLDMLGDAAQWLEKNCERTDGVWRVR